MKDIEITNAQSDEQESFFSEVFGEAIEQDLIDEYRTIDVGDFDVYICDDDLVIEIELEEAEYQLEVKNDGVYVDDQKLGLEVSEHQEAIEQLRKLAT